MTTTPRPTRNDPDILASAAEILAEQIVEGWDPKGSIEDWKNALLENEAIARVYDGYSLARKLENSGITPDVRLVQLLEDGMGVLDELHEETVKQWVKATDIKPDRAIFDKVSTSTGPGIINAILVDEAMYLIAPNDGNPTMRKSWTVNYEDCNDPEFEGADT